MRTRDNSRKKSKTAQGFFALLICCAVGITGSSNAQATNTSLGTLALSSNTTGHNNSAVGYHALRYNTTGSYNSAFGSTALESNVNGNSNSAFGMKALSLNSSGGSNCAFGIEALERNTSGSSNSSFGAYALKRNTTGYENAAFGADALTYNTTGYENAAFGTQALLNNTTGDENAAFGARALIYNQVGAYNSAFGYSALENNTASSNSAFGHSALYSNTTGTNNSAFGYRTLYSNQTGYGNSAFGYNTLQNNISDNNTAFGFNALLNSWTGTRNVAVGNSSMMGNTTGDDNSAVGSGSMRYNGTGSKNAALGSAAMYWNTSGSCNVAVGYGAGPSSSYPNLQNAIAIGYEARVTASNSVRIGNTSITSIGGYANWSNLSDARVKNNVQANVPGIDFIKKLRPVTYTYDWDAYDKLVGFSSLSKEGAAARAAKEQIVYTGFIAQEVEQAAKELQYDFSGVDKPGNENTPYSLRYAEFVVPVVKATQEQQVLIEAQQKKLAVQEGEITTLKQRLAKLEHLLLQNTTDVEPADGVHDESSFIVYPNPSDGMVRIALQGKSTFPAELQVYDATGKLVLSKTVSSGVGETSFDLSGKVAGSYIVTLVQGQQKVSKVVTVSGK